MTKQGKLLFLGLFLLIVTVAILIFAIDWTDLKMKKEIRQSEFEIKGIVAPEGWYAHPINNELLIFTRQKELPDIGATEGYAYGEQIGISVSKTNLSPEEWLAQQGFDSKDALTKKWEWDAIDGYRVLRIGHETPAAPQHTEFIFIGDRVYIFYYYPLELFNQENNRQVFEQMIRKFIQNENCKRTEFPRSDDSSFDPEKKIVTLYYWDEKLQDNAKIELPYEPEKDFEGCSESAKTYLRHIQETVVFP